MFETLPFLFLIGEEPRDVVRCQYFVEIGHEGVSVHYVAQ